MSKILWIIGLCVIAILVVRAQDAPQREIYTALKYGDDIFEPDVWLASAEEETSRTTATWTAHSLDALAFVSFLHFDNGIKPEALDAFFNDDWFKGTFSNYKGYREMNRCHKHDLILHEFSMLVNNLKYTMHYWIRPISDTRVLALFVIFPTTDRDKLDDYGKKLFPDLINCSA
jgi:hypothetical protein